MAKTLTSPPSTRDSPPPGPAPAPPASAPPPERLVDLTHRKWPRSVPDRRVFPRH